MRLPRPLASTVLLLLLPALLPAASAADDLETLAAEFWEWRAVHQPLTGDGIPRIERPARWSPDWSAAAVARRRADLDDFRARWKALAPAADPASEAAAEGAIARRVDYRLIGSALARVEWELDIHPVWRIDPWFYVQQSEGAIFELLLEPPPFTAERSAEILIRMESIPNTIFEARRNLDLLVRPFAEATLAHLRNTRGRLQATASQLRPLLAEIEAERFYEATEAAIAALEGFARWLEEQLPRATDETAIGAEAYDFLLRRVALIPWSRDELVTRARQELERAVTFETFERRRNRDLPELALAADQETQIARSASDEIAIRGFLAEHGLLTLPDGMGHYLNQPMPPYLQPLRALGVTDDLTGESRLGENGVGYLLPPSAGRGYFRLSAAKDPRPILVHEGVPGRYAQLAISRAHENPIRRRYYASAANEGIAFYAEEMLLRAGLFDDSPRTREIVYSFMRLRALRVEVDIGLATGEWSIEAAADFLERTVPMDRSTALAEAVFVASTPGQAISYQVGKLQVVRFLGEARLAEGENFSLLRFHDALWRNGNVPIALQRWEYLGLGDDLADLADLADLSREE